MEEKQSFLSKTRTFIQECKRVLRVTRKPTGDEFRTIVKMSGLGIVVIGVIGFIVSMASQLLK